MKRTTKSCSTYLSANRLQRGHCINRTSPTPVALALDKPSVRDLGVAGGMLGVVLCAAAVVFLDLLLLCKTW